MEFGYLLLEILVRTINKWNRTQNEQTVQPLPSRTQMPHAYNARLQTVVWAVRVDESKSEATTKIMNRTEQITRFYNGHEVHSSADNRHECVGVRKPT